MKMAMRHILPMTLASSLLYSRAQPKKVKSIVGLLLMRTIPIEQKPSDHLTVISMGLRVAQRGMLISMTMSMIKV